MTIGDTAIPEISERRAMKPEEQGTYQRRHHEHRHDGPDHGALPFLLDDAQKKEAQRHFGNGHSHDDERLADGFEEDGAGDVVVRNDGDSLTEAIIGGDGHEETETGETNLLLLATMTRVESWGEERTKAII